MNKITLKEFYRRATAKNIKTMRGHDGPSQEWDVYFDNKKICNCWDDSYGGELQVTNYDGKSIEDIFDTIDKESRWDPDYKWHTSLDLIMYEIKSKTQIAKDIKTKTDGFVLNWEYLEACEIKVPEKLRWSKAKYVSAFRK